MKNGKNGHGKNGHSPVTRDDLHAALSGLNDDLTEKMRQIETNLVAAFRSYSITGR